jgi:xylulokinase
MTDSRRNLYLGIDVGTQSTKALLIDTSKRKEDAVIARASEAYDLIAGLPAGAAEQHPHTWRDAVKKVIASVLEGGRSANLGGIGISGQQHGLVTLDADNEVVRPAKLWCDTTTVAEADEITKRSQYAVPTGFTLPKVLWMKRHEPANFARVASVLLPHDYINFLFTGRKFMEAGDASGSGAFDPKTRSFNMALLDWLDPKARSFFPELVAPNLPGGTVTEHASREFGLPVGLPVAPGGGDNMMSAIGSGATIPGITVVSLGTSGTAFSYAPEPIIDPLGAIAPFCDSTGGWMPLLCTMNVTGVAEEMRDALDGRSHQELTQLARAVAPGCDGLLLLPYLVGERVPNLPHATGSLHGIRPGLLTPGHLYRSVLEGTALGLVSGIERMKTLGLEVNQLRMVGGGSKNALWCQIFADALGVKVNRLVEPESAALGAALQAAWVVGNSTGAARPLGDWCADIVQLDSAEYTPDPAATAVYKQSLKRFNELTQRVYG